MKIRTISKKYFLFFISSFPYNTWFFSLLVIHSVIYTYVCVYITNKRNTSFVLTIDQLED